VTKNDNLLFLFVVLGLRTVFFSCSLSTPHESSVFFCSGLEFAYVVTSPSPSKKKTGNKRPFFLPCLFFGLRILRGRSYCPFSLDITFSGGRSYGPPPFSIFENQGRHFPFGGRCYFHLPASLKTAVFQALLPGTSFSFDVNYLTTRLPCPSRPRGPSLPLKERRDPDSRPSRFSPPPFLINHDGLDR